jgi:hypothetical protein
VIALPNADILFLSNFILPLIGTIAYFAMRPTLDDEAERIIAREARRH